MKHILLLLALAMSVSSSAHGAAIVAGGFSTNRAGASSLTEGPYTQDLRSSLVTAFPGSTFASLDTLTVSALSGVDLVIVGSKTASLPGMTLSSSEQTALLNFILAGHGAIIYLENQDYSGGPNESFLVPFGMHLTGKIQSAGTSIAPNHRVMNGPFGVVTTFATNSVGWFDNLGPNAVALANLDANGQPALAAIAPGALGPGSGGVVFISDADALVDTAVGGLFGAADNQNLFLNAVAYVPEPSTALLLACAGIVLTTRRRV